MNFADFLRRTPLSPLEKVAMSQVDSEISENVRPLRSRRERIWRLIWIGLLAVAVASPTVARLWQKHNVARLVAQYHSLMEQGCYEEAKWVANFAVESYPDSKLAKYIAVQSKTLLWLTNAAWDFDDDDDPFSASAFDFSDQES